MNATEIEQEGRMNDVQLEAFRRIADAMNPELKTWQWIGKWSSQRMFGITEKRAQEYTLVYGGTAREMDPK